MKSFFIRHLKTEWNQALRMQGRRDIPILPPDPDTLAEIADNRKLLKPHLDESRVIVSRLRRTQETARLYGLEDFEIDPLADELDFGSYEGQARGRMLEELGEGWIETPSEITLGEPLSALERRIREFVEKYRGAGIVCFCHGMWLRGLISILRQGDVDLINKIEIENNRILELDLG